MDEDGGNWTVVSHFALSVSCLPLDVAAPLSLACVLPHNPSLSHAIPLALSHNPSLSLSRALSLVFLS